METIIVFNKTLFTLKKIILALQFLMIVFQNLSFNVVAIYYNFYPQRQILVQSSKNWSPNIISLKTPIPLLLQLSLSSLLCHTPSTPQGTLRRTPPQPPPPPLYHRISHRAPSTTTSVRIGSYFLDSTRLDLNIKSGKPLQACELFPHQTPHNQDFNFGKGKPSEVNSVCVCVWEGALGVIMVYYYTLMRRFLQPMVPSRRLLPCKFESNRRRSSLQIPFYPFISLVTCFFMFTVFLFSTPLLV